MKNKIAVLETKIEQHDEKINELYKIKEKVQGLHNWKGESDKLMHSLRGMFDILEKNQKDLKEEWKNSLNTLKNEIHESYKIVSKDVAQLMNWKFILVGGGVVGSIMVGGAITMLKMYLDYHK
jgi:hypothetical protein